MKLPPVFYWSFGGVGSLLVFIAATIFYFNQKAANQFTHVEGIVEGKSQFDGSPLIVYSLDGSDHHFTTNTYTNPSTLEVGERVELFINPSDPLDVRINNFSERWLAMTIVGGIGLLFLGFLALFHYLSGR